MDEGSRFSNGAEERIAEQLRTMRFRKRVFLGVDERDVWQKISELNEAYKKALLEERARYEALLQERHEGGGTA
ncbi:MAG: hypothetical protein IKP40_02005 [Clostridia bacterium]|nr:hypothetical protein [Clostridia bacterium]